jgi:hypothetical protein
LLTRVADDATEAGASWVLDHLAGLAARGGPAAGIRDRFVLTDDPREATRHIIDTGAQSVLDCPVLSVPALSR